MGLECHTGIQSALAESLHYFCCQTYKQHAVRAISCLLWLTYRAYKSYCRALSLLAQVVAVFDDDICECAWQRCG